MAAVCWNTCSEPAGRVTAGIYSISFLTFWGVLSIVDHMDSYPPAQGSTCEGHVTDSVQTSSESNVIHEFLRKYS